MRKSRLIPFLALVGLPLLAACNERSQQGGGPVVKSEPAQQTEVQEPTTSVPPTELPTPDPGPALLEIESDPSGAGVYVGAHSVDGILYPERGRLACTTPCRVQLQMSDVNEGGGISVLLKKEGYLPFGAGLSDGRKKIEHGGVYRLRDGPFPLRRLGE
jgi:hypothetical protein